MASTLQTMRSGGTEHPEEIINFINSRLVDTGGIFDTSGTQFKVAEEDTPAMSVKIQEGYAFLPNSSGSMVYPIRLYDGDASVSISANSSGNDRIDAVVLYIDLSATANAQVTNVAKFIVVEGTPAGSPTAPTNSDIETEIGASNPYLRLADVEVGNGAVSIVDADITDQRTQVTYIENIGGADWKTISGTFSRNSADDPTYILKIIGQDLTSTLGVGMRLKWTQNSIVRYGIITKVALSGSDTDVTILTRCDDTSGNYDLLDTTTYPLTDLNYSSVYCPFGFDVDKNIWTVIYELSSGSKSGATDNVWYNIGGSIIVPIGVWKVSMSLKQFSPYKTNVSVLTAKVTLSTANNSESDDKMTHFNGGQQTNTGGSTWALDQGAYKEKLVKYTSKTTLYCNLLSTSNSGNLSCSGIKLSAVCQYV